MKTFLKQLLPFILILSLAGNVYAGITRYDRDIYLNRYTWGNAVSGINVSLVGLRNNVLPSPDGTIPADNPQVQAITELDLVGLRNLPDYASRVNNDDLERILQFIRYAGAAYSVALQEQQATGRISEDSDQRLRKTAEGINLILRDSETFSGLSAGKNPWNHAAWRATWHRIAADLTNMDFVPLPE